MQRSQNNLPLLVLGSEDRPEEGEKVGGGGIVSGPKILQKVQYPGPAHKSGKRYGRNLPRQTKQQFPKSSRAPPSGPGPTGRAPSAPPKSPLTHSVLGAGPTGTARPGAPRPERRWPTRSVGAVAGAEAAARGVARPGSERGWRSRPELGGGRGGETRGKAGPARVWEVAGGG